jgi:hypothetical protein
MSAQAVNALHQQAHALDAEADAAEAEPDGGINAVKIERHPSLLRLIAKEFHELADRMEGKDPATVNAQAQANQQMDAAAATDGMAVMKDLTDDA